jgi:hypothetical protein
MSITQNHIVEFSALVVSIFYWRKIKKSKLKSMPFFLLFILIVELMGNYFQKIRNANAVLYNISIPIEYLFYFLLYWLHGGKLLKMVSIVSAFSLLVTAFFYFIQSKVIYFHSYVLVEGQIGVVICTCIYIYEQFVKGDEDSLLKNYFFLLSSGLFLFNLGELTYFLFYPLIFANKWDKFDFIFMSVNNSLLILLYLSYIISILVLSKPRIKDA